MKTPPFTWSAEDIAKLVPGCAVVRLSERYREPGRFDASLLTVVKVYGDTAFFRSGASMFGDDSFFGVPLANLDPDSITSAESLAGVEEQSPTRQVH